ncbi:MAG: response regulator transcription factor [Verrucomicrobia bacterium]|nr:response regulator transcription factor [Verrucomicrobiota bacterium]
MPSTSQSSPAPRSETAAGVRVLLVDDHHIVRVGLRTVLGEDRRISVVGDAATASDALTQAVRLRPQVVLLDLRLPDRSGLEVCRLLKQYHPAPMVLCLTSFADDQTILAAIEAGADGYLLKEVDGPNIGDAIVTVARGGSVMDPRVTRRMLGAVRDRTGAGELRRKLDRLSAQERRVLAVVSQGKTNKEVAEILSLGSGTVRNYLATVFQKLEVARRAEAVALWVRSESRPED